MQRAMVQRRDGYSVAFASHAVCEGGPGPSMPKVDSFYMLGIAFQKCCVEEGKLGVSWFSSDPAIW